MKLWLDDERPAPQGWAWVGTAPKAIRAIGLGLVDEVSLDHDLGPQDAGTGYDVLCFIEERAVNQGIAPPVIHVHTANPVARTRMLQTIESIKRHAKPQTR